MPVSNAIATVRPLTLVTQAHKHCYCVATAFMECIPSPSPILPKTTPFHFNSHPLSPAATCPPPRRVPAHHRRPKEEKRKRLKRSATREMQYVSRRYINIYTCTCTHKYIHTCVHLSERFRQSKDRREQGWGIRRCRWRRGIRCTTARRRTGRGIRC